MPGTTVLLIAAALLVAVLIAYHKRADVATVIAVVLALLGQTWTKLLAMFVKKE